MYQIRILPALLLCAYTVLTPVQAADTRSMADAMLNMMEAMGRFGRNYMGSGTQDAFSHAWETMVPNGAPPSEPGLETNTPAPLETATNLEGNWLGAGGEQLRIRGSRFQLDAGRSRRLEGLLQTRGKLLALYSPQHRKSWVYEYAEDRGRLALRSAEGQLLLFRRVDSRESRERRR
jgi:hypothetical protein